MFKEIYEESLALDAKVEEILGAEFRAMEGRKDAGEVERTITDLKSREKAGKDKTVGAGQQISPGEILQVKSLLYAVNEDRKRLRAQNFSLICSQTLNPEKAANSDLAQELQTLILQLESEKEEKNQLQVLLEIISAQMKTKKEAERIPQKPPPHIDASVISVTVEPPEVPFRSLMRKEQRTHTTNASLPNLELESESLIPSPRPSRIPVPSRIPQLTKTKK